MEAVFFKLLNMSITASWIALAVIIFRLVFRKAPKWIVCVLWSLVGLRLLLPFSIESVMSLIPTAEPIPQSVIEVVTPEVNVNVNAPDITPSVPDVIIPPSANVETTVPLTDPVLAEPASEINVMGVVSVIWMVGVCAMLIYMLVSYLNVYSKVKASIQIRDGVYVCDNINTPFILGIIRPRIFMPSSMRDSEIDYVVSHELAHISRRDHYWKPLGFLILSVYWFNPVMWLTYVLLCRDIEFACDERVIKRMSAEQKRQYTTVLLNCSVPKKMIAACPLAFGEVGVKNRIKSVLNYKKPAFWIIILAVIASIVVAVCFLTNPVEDTDSPLELGQDEITLSPVEVLYHNHLNTMSEYTAENAPYYRMDEDNKLYRLEKGDSEWEFFAEMQKIELDESNFSSRFHRDGEALYGKVCLIDNEELENIQQNNKVAYQGWRDHESYQSFYMLLEQNDGTFYVAYGNKENNVSSEDIKNGLIFLLYRAEITEEELPDNNNTNISTVEFLYHSSYDIASESIMEKARYFRIDKENRFYYLGEEFSWNFGGDVTEIKLTEDELSAIFNTIPAQGVNETRGNLDAGEMIRNNETTYKCILDNGSSGYLKFYLLLFQNDGAIYIIYGNESSETTIYFVCRAEETDKELPDKIYDGSIPNNGAQIFYFNSPIDEDNTEELKSAESTAEVKTFEHIQRTKLLKILKSNKFIWDALLDRITFEYDGVIDLYVGGEKYKIYFSYEHNVLYCNQYLCEISEFDMERIKCAFSDDYNISFDSLSVVGINARSLDSTVDSTSGIYKDAINADKLNDENEHHFPVHRISSEKALREFIDKYGDEISLDELKPVNSRYYQEFFDDNELFIVYVSSNMIISYEFENLAVLEDNVIKFNFTQNGEETIKGSALICVSIPKLYVSYFAAGFDAMVTETETETKETPEIESKIFKRPTLGTNNPILDAETSTADNIVEYHIYKIDTYEKLTEIKTIIAASDGIDSKEFSSSFNESTQNYDQKFFEKNNLFAIHFAYPYIGNDYMGVEVEKSGDTVYFYIPLKGVGPSLFTHEGVLAIATLPKSYTEDVSFYYLGFRSYTETNYTQTYTYKSGYEVIPATILLSDNGRFMFSYSALSSNVPMGKYEITDDKMILTSDNGDVYVFNVVGEGFAFDASLSADIPRYKISSGSKETYSPVPDGAIFQRTVNISIPKVLDKAIEWEIRDAYAAGLKNEFGQRMLAEEVKMVEYCGIYNGARVVMLNVNSWETPAELTSETVNGTVFEYTDGTYTLKVYKDGRFYSLESAFEQGILSARDLESIAYIHNRGLYAKPANSTTSLVDINGYDGPFINEVFEKAEKTASYFTGYARGVYGDESIEYEGVRYDRFTVCDSLEELRAIVSESFDDQLTEQFMNTTVDGLPLYVEEGGKLYRFGGYVALESYESATPVIHEAEMIYDRDTVVIEVTVGYSGYRYLLRKAAYGEPYKFSVRYMLPIEIATYKR